MIKRSCACPPRPLNRRRSSSGSEEGSRSSMRSAPSAPTGTISEEGGWRWDPASLNAVLSR